MLTGREFAFNTVSLSPGAATRAITTISQRFNNPPRQPAELLDLLEHRYAMNEAVALIRPLLTAPEGS